MNGGWKGASTQSIKDEGLKFHGLIAGMGNSREISLAKTKIEEAVMWAEAHHSLTPAPAKVSA